MWTRLNYQLNPCTQQMLIIIIIIIITTTSTFIFMNRTMLGLFRPLEEYVGISV
jgi:hypothetical protein